MANRKLMAEVDRTVKKVNEGIENFDELEEKVYSAQSSSQRDKFEGELKKEIKKLQRLRETIRGWISGNEIKDKDLLVEKRQQIETRMERFKKCEQKTKMKAYSKEALSKSQVEKRSRNKQNIIPDSKEKKQAKKWLKDMIETLTNAVDSIEEKIEEEEEKEKKKDGDMIETHRSRQRKHEDYIDKLNQVYEFLDNDEGVTPQDLEELKEYVEYYVDENEEAEFVEDDDSFETIFRKHKEWEESAPKEELVDVDEVKDSIKNSDDYDDEDSDDGFDEDLDSDDDDGSSNVDDDEDLSSPISTSSKDEDKKKKSPPNTTTPAVTTPTTTTPPVVNVNPSITKPSGSNLTVTAVVTKEKKITKQAPPAISTTPNQPSTQQPSGQVTPNTTTPTATKPSYSDLVKSPKTPLQPQQPTPSNTTATNATTTATKQPTATTIPTTASTPTATPTGSTTPTTTIKKPVVSYIDIAQQNKNAPQGHNLTVSISDANKQQQVATPTVASTTTPTTTASSKNAKQQPTTTATATATKQATTKAQPAQPTKKAQTNANQSTTPTSTTPVQNISSTPSPTTIDKNNDETFSAGLQPQFGLEDLSSQTQMQQSLFVHQQMHKLQQGGMPMFPQNNMPPSFVSQIQPNQIPSFPQNPTNPILNNNNMINNISTPFANDNNSIINSTYMNDMLQSSMKHIPEPYDCNSVYSYIPINENTDFRNEADGFPTESPLTNGLHPLSNPQTYSQLESDTLFFIFYFQQGTYHQYLAAKELKRQAWRYHKKYLTWFQRHDKPTLTTTDYEQGTYIYFDFETLWCQRIKDGFSFEYAFLEDEL